MSIAGVENIQGAAVANSVSQQTLGKDDFLNLLVTQLKAQDPLNPMEGTEFTAQLAQFTSLEQLYNVNTNLGNMQASQLALNNSEATSFIDRTVTAVGNSISLTQEGDSDIAFMLEADAQAVLVDVYSPGGELVQTIASPALVAGEQILSWDGNDGSGRRASSGEYYYEVRATDVNDHKVAVNYYTRGTVSAVAYEGGRAYLIAGQSRIPIENVFRVEPAGDQG
jgi:flagellar basal-body rod modification protein FlgD